MFDRTHDARVRSAAFEWLADQVMRCGDVLPRKVLEQGFFLDEMRRELEKNPVLLGILGQAEV